MLSVINQIFSLFRLVTCNLLLSHFNPHSLSLSIKWSSNHAIKRAELTNFFCVLLRFVIQSLISVQYIYVPCRN